MNTSRPLILSAAAVSVAALSACGGSGSSQPTVPTIQPARTFAFTGFEPSGQVVPGKPATVAFTIRQPDGRPLVHFRRGAGPHTGVHVIIVRDDLSTIIHRHPPVAADGRISEQVVFPAPGTYRDGRGRLSAAQRRLSATSSSSGRSASRARTRRQPLPPFRPTDVVDGYRVTMHGRPALKAIQANFLTVTVTDPNGKPAKFTPWYGALAHAIFFRQGSLDYFHTHVCAPGASGCTSLLGGASVAGTSSTPGSSGRRPGPRGRDLAPLPADQA